MFVIQIRSNSGCDIRHAINITFVTYGIGKTEKEIANFIREYNELALMNIDPIDNVEDRAHALAYFLERLTSENTIE